MENRGGSVDKIDPTAPGQLHIAEWTRRDPDPPPESCNHPADPRSSSPSPSADAILLLFYKRPARSSCPSRPAHPFDRADVSRDAAIRCTPTSPPPSPGKYRLEKDTKISFFDDALEISLA